MLLCTALETARNFAKKIGDKYCRVVSNEYPSAMEAIMRRLYWTGLYCTGLDRIWDLGSGLVKKTFIDDLCRFL